MNIIALPTSHGPMVQASSSLCGPQPLPVRAIHSTSTGTPLGSSFTATQDREGLCVKYFSYTPFISAKLLCRFEVSICLRRPSSFLFSCDRHFLKLTIDVRNTVTCFGRQSSETHPLLQDIKEKRDTLTTRSIELPASSRMFFTPSQQAVVLSAMLPSTRFPSASAGI